MPSLLTGFFLEAAQKPSAPHLSRTGIGLQVDRHHIALLEGAKELEQTTLLPLATRLLVASTNVDHLIADRPFGIVSLTALFLFANLLGGCRVGCLGLTGVVLAGNGLRVGESVRELVLADFGHRHLLRFRFRDFFLALFKGELEPPRLISEQILVRC